MRIGLANGIDLEAFQHGIDDRNRYLAPDFIDALDLLIENYGAVGLATSKNLIRAIQTV